MRESDNTTFQSRDGLNPHSTAIANRLTFTDIISEHTRCERDRPNNMWNNAPATWAKQQTGTTSVRKHGIEEQQRELWNTAEKLGALACGAWAAKKFGANMCSPIKSVNEFARGANRLEGIANSFGCVAASVFTTSAIDDCIWSADQKKESTVGADWLVGPAISVQRYTWATKLGWMTAAHLAGRLVDHFNQGATFINHRANAKYQFQENSINLDQPVATSLSRS